MAIAPALAADPFGTWLTEDFEKAAAFIVNCGGALCGNLVWLKEPIDPDTNKPKPTSTMSMQASRADRCSAVPIVLSMKPSGRHAGKMGRTGLQRRRRQYLFGLVRHDRRQYRATQGLRARRADLQGTGLDADEFDAGTAHSAVVILARWPNNTARP